MTPSRRQGGPVDLVLEGGGVKGIALAGALATLEERGYEAQNLAGASAGAIAATLYAAGYSAEELHRELGTIPFSSFLDEGLEDRIPVVGKGISILLDHGIYEGRAFFEWMREMLARKGKHTFADLIHPDYADDPRYRHRVQVIVSDLTARRLLVLPRDAEEGLGVPADELEIAMAVRMSMGTPIFFEPVRWKNPRTGEEHVIVDGGILSNFPVWLFDADGEPDWPTFGLLLSEPKPRETAEKRVPAASTSGDPVSALISYLKSLVGTMTEAHDRLYLEQADYARTITVPTLGVGTTEFDLAPERSEALYESGRRAAEHFLDEVWDFEGYKAHFRQGKRHSRRRELAATMRGEEERSGGAA
ncbi:MAG: patatin-like phospholipase family protein [Thermoleophilaceae bacterium]